LDEMLQDIEKTAENFAAKENKDNKKKCKRESV
jgi:hypothetical protein